MESKEFIRNLRKQTDEEAWIYMARCLIFSAQKHWRDVRDHGTTRGCSSVGRAPALQAGGQGFESLHLHHTEIHIGS